jgi:flagellar FliJ protein
MAQNSALSTLKDLAEKEVDDAALQLGAMRRGCQQAEEQLKMLIDYQHEYRTNLNTDMTQGIGSQRWINYQQFIQTLEKAIDQHRQQLNQWTQKVDTALNFWREKKATAGLAELTGPTDRGNDPGGKPSGSEENG